MQIPNQEPKLATTGCIFQMKPTKKGKRANSTPACACCATATRPQGVQDTAPLVASPLLGSSDHPKQS
ncbi:hypothetical protein MAR_012334 [Mya arenaria]|uniref:Uncharacterized protein n=1 Tax=Mya arenaria TaxID=6604 RepID=A0ABY7FWR1_MYAAR|nr:hypothetical protein MAR_012334 [Mya arenaria]